MYLSFLNKAVQVWFFPWRWGKHKRKTAWLLELLYHFVRSKVFFSDKVITFSYGKSAASWSKAVTIFNIPMGIFSYFYEKKIYLKYRFFESEKKKSWWLSNFGNNEYSHCKHPQRRQWHPTPVLLPGKSHGRRSLVDCSPWGREESDMTEWIYFHFSFLSIGEGNGNPLQCPCLENSRDSRAWWAAVYGVSQSWTWLETAAAANIHM